MTQLPVKLTDPLTAILYITADRTHMLEMKEALHLRQVAEGQFVCLSVCLSVFVCLSLWSVSLQMVCYIS